METIVVLLMADYDEILALSCCNWSAAKDAVFLSKCRALYLVLKKS